MATLTPDCTDTQLLRKFAQLRSNSAFRELTQRHVNLFFGTAFRATNERSSVEEITQNVFLVLAKKAIWLQHEGSVAAWLHRATLMEARQSSRSSPMLKFVIQAKQLTPATIPERLRALRSLSNSAQPSDRSGSRALSRLIANRSIVRYLLAL